MQRAKQSELMEQKKQKEKRTSKKKCINKFSERNGNSEANATANTHIHTPLCVYLSIKNPPVFWEFHSLSLCSYKYIYIRIICRVHTKQTRRTIYVLLMHMIRFVREIECIHELWNRFYTFCTTNIKYKKGRRKKRKYIYYYIAYKHIQMQTMG